MQEEDDRITLASLYHFTTRFTRDISFFEENPDLQYMKPYVDLIADKGIKEAGKIMDAIWMAYDPKSSYQNSKEKTETEIRQEIAKYLLKDESFDWKEYDRISDAYKKHSRTPLESDVLFYRNKLDQLKEYLDKQPISVSAETVLQSMAHYKTLVQDYTKMEELANTERKEKKLRSNIKRSRVERI